MKQPILKIKNMHKTFPGVYALKGVEFDIFPGEVHALVGENGAGKSTLIKIMSGVYDFSEGEYEIEGKSANIQNPLDAINKGLSVIYQELNLVGSLSVAENVYFGRLPAKNGQVKWKELYSETKRYLEMVGLNVDPRLKVQYLSVAQQQLVEIAKAISLNSKVIIMDEPTSALSPKEIEYLFKVIRELSASSVGIVYVSHKLSEIFELSNRITVFRDGQRVGTVNTGDVGEQHLIMMMVGRELADMFPKHTPAIGDVMLDVKDLTTEKVSDITFNIRKGEIVGFSGLMGAGRTELTMALFGVDRHIRGTITIDGKKLAGASPNEARKSGLGLVPENRKEGGIFPGLSVLKNMTIVSLSYFTSGIHIHTGAERKSVQDMINSISIRTPSMEQLVSKLSGGNQQKVLLARWLLKKDLKLLIIDEPTRGIDVGAKAEIYEIMVKLADQGLSILMVSSELPELLGVCDRIYVMKNGRITGEFNKSEASEELLLEKAIH
ncbi:MAG: sugar ABC transporter ATP-binding protein [Oscillospiraceae bacterium]|nr:sugar ABC transporter ATP-binding protein [Oscillospiraceae bacterium]